MENVAPKVPANLNPLARELLEGLQGHAEAAEIVIGGGVALSHYLEYRETVDLDAWWRETPNPQTLYFVEGCMKTLAERHAMTCRRRAWGETESLEVLRAGRKQFAFQISQRTLSLDDAIPAHWRPVWIETLRDNVASKMTALVERGAPRDLKDIFELCRHGVLEPAECWNLWRIKNPARDPREGPEKTLFFVQRLEMQRPLETVPEDQREQAADLRRWYRELFCPAGFR